MESEEDSETVSYHAPCSTDSSTGVFGQLPPGLPGVPFIPEASSISLENPAFHGFSPSDPPTLGAFYLFYHLRHSIIYLFPCFF